MLILGALASCISGYYKPRLKLFEKLFGGRVIDALLHMPLHTVEKLQVDKLSRDYVGKIVTTRLRVDCIETSHIPSRPTVVYGKNGDELVEIALFNYPKAYIRSTFRLDEEVCVSGKLGVAFSGALQFINPEKVPLAKFDHGVSFSNVYPLTTGLTQKAIYSVMRAAFDRLEKSSLPEWLPANVLSHNSFCSFTEALRNIHFPKEQKKEQLDDGFRRRLAFDELLAEQLSIRVANSKTKHGHIIENASVLANTLREALPFALTAAQERALADILQDMRSGAPMARLLQGDVGSGKTIVAVLAALYAIESGFQCAFLAPTEILAQQHYATIKSLFEEVELSVELLTSSEKGRKRREILEKVANGTVNVLVGTHAIITERVNFHNLGFVIIDEQHRFGVEQRLQLIEKGVSPHVLSMTATPIPRTIVMSLYGDIAVSSITEKPAGRREIITRAIPLSRISDTVKSIGNILSQGQKVYWICPVVEENERSKYTCVINRFEFLKKYFSDDVEMLHGKMKSAEKQRVFERFCHGGCKILVATTVVEVGIDVPEASVIFIENAEKFGLAQLHQLRGRVGRSDLQSYCILLFDTNISDIAKKRINVIRETNDGFKIAEEDLRLRGSGEILGTKQSGEKTYRTFEINDPRNQPHLLDLLTQTSKLATKIVDAGQLKDYELLLKIFQKDNIGDLKMSF